MKFLSDSDSLEEMMKRFVFTKRIIALLVLITMLLSLCFPIVSAKTNDKSNLEYIVVTECSLPELDYNSAEEMVAEMEEIAKAGEYIFYMNISNGTFAIMNSINGEITCSNPYNAARSTEFVGNTKNDLQSQIILRYADYTNAIHSLWSSSDSIGLNQFSYSYIDNGISVRYSMGKEQNQYVIPEVITESHFESKILKKIDDEYERESITYMYQLLSLEDVQDESERSQILKDYPYLEKENLYCVRPSLSDVERERLNQKIADAGYTVEDLKAEYKLLSYTSSASSSANFKVTVNYTLSEGGLNVSIPASEIEYDTETFNLKDISLLPYFGAQVYSGNNGYILLPDGSGTIIPFSENELPQKQASLEAKIYGLDCGVSYPETPSNTYSFSLPIYGINNGNTGIFGIVEDGSGLSSISARVLGGLDYVYAAYPVFTYLTSEQTTLEAKVDSAYSSRDVTIFDTNAYSGDYSVNYYFLDDGKSTYSDMAAIYRNYIKSLRNTESNGENSIVLQIETLGTVVTKASFLGISYDKAVELTTFAQNIEILNELKEKGIDNVTLFADAWRKNGFDASACNTFDPASNLGGKKGFSNLWDWCDNNDVSFYPSADFIFVSKDKWFDGFKATKDSVRLLNSKYGGFMSIRPDMSIYDEKTFRYALSSGKYQEYATKFLKKYNKNGFDSLCFSNAGVYLNTNFKSKNEYNREQSLDILVNQISEASKNNDLAFDGFNAYVLPYARYLSNIPTEDSGLTLTSRRVPFVQMTVNGLINYSGEVLNFSEDIDKAVLRCIETSSSPSFIFAYDNAEKLKNTVYTKYYSVNYMSWKDRAISIYKEVAEALKDTEDAYIVSHEYLTSEVVCTVYSNGVKIYVNYGKTDFNFDGITVQAESYCSVK